MHKFLNLLHWLWILWGATEAPAAQGVRCLPTGSGKNTAHQKCPTGREEKREPSVCPSCGISVGLEPRLTPLCRKNQYAFIRLLEWTGDRPTDGRSGEVFVPFLRTNSKPAATVAPFQGIEGAQNQPESSASAQHFHGALSAFASCFNSFHVRGDQDPRRAPNESAERCVADRSASTQSRQGCLMRIQFRNEELSSLVGTSYWDSLLRSMALQGWAVNSATN